LFFWNRTKNEIRNRVSTSKRKKQNPRESECKTKEEIDTRDKLLLTSDWLPRRNQLTSRRDRKLKSKPCTAASQQKRIKEKSEDVFVNNEGVIDITYIFPTFSR